MKGRWSASQGSTSLGSSRTSDTSRRGRWTEAQNKKKREEEEAELMRSRVDQLRLNSTKTVDAAAHDYPDLGASWQQNARNRQATSPVAEFGSPQPVAQFQPNTMDLAAEKLQEQMLQTRAANEKAAEEKSLAAARYQTALSNLDPSAKDWDERSREYQSALAGTVKYGGIENMLDKNSMDPNDYYKTLYNRFSRGDWDTSTRYNAGTADEGSLYQLVNDKDKMDEYFASEFFSGGGGQAGYDGGRMDATALRYMSDEQRNIYNYIYSTKGRDQAKQYLEDIMPTLTPLQREDITRAAQEFADENPGLASAVSTLYSPFKASAYVNQIIDYTKDRKIDENASYNAMSYVPTAIRSKVSEDMNGVERFLYQTGMSMGDFLLNSALTGNFSGLRGSAAKVAEWASLGLMGAGAAADTLIEKKDAGFSDDDAFWIGTIAGAAEIITEKISLESLLNPERILDGSLKYILKNMLAEGSEEVGSDLINWATDALFSIASNAPTKLREELESGKPWYSIVWDYAKEAGLDFLGGALSGGVMAGAGTTIDIGRQTKEGSQIKSGNNDDVTLSELSEMAQKPDMEGSLFKRTYDELMSKSQNISDLSNRDVGRLSDAMYYTTGQRFGAELSLLAANDKINSGQELTDQDIDSISENDEAVNFLRRSVDFGDANLERDAETRRLAIRDALAKYNTTVKQNRETVKQAAGSLRGMTQLGIDTILANYDGTSDPYAYVEAMGTAFQIGMLGQDNNSDYLKNIGNAISEEKKQAAFRAGRAQYNINTYGEVTTNEETGEPELRLRDGLQWYDSQDSGEQIQGMEQTPGGPEVREGETGPSWSGQVPEVRQRNITSSNALGIEGGTDRRNIYTIERGTGDAIAEQARQMIEAKGYKAVLFAGGALEKDGKNLRGFIQRGADGSTTVYIRADHHVFTADQIAGHELMHARIMDGEVDLNEMRGKMETVLGGRRNFDRAMRNYYAIYDGAGYTDMQIFEEAVCDAAGGMNEFAAHGRERAYRQTIPLYDLARRTAEQVQKPGKASGKSAQAASADLVSQAISSADTSLNQVPALHKDARVVWGDVNIDIGAGAYDAATNYLKDKGVTNLKWDPYNQSESVNRATLKYLQDGNKADTATSANVLNVIAEEDARLNVILQAAKSIKRDGKAYFMVYEGDGSGIGRKTSKGWQNNLKTREYADEIRTYFNNVQVKGKLIVASDPKANLPQASWEVKPGMGVRYSIDLFADASGVDAYKDSAGKIHFSVNGRQVDEITAEHIKNSSAIGTLITTALNNGFIKKAEARKQYQAAADIMNMIMSTQDPELIWAWTGAAMFSALKKNSDNQYGTTIDFTTVCRKTQEMVTAMSNAMKAAGRGLTKAEVTALQHKVYESGAEVPCPVCYVFSRWAGIGGMLDDIVELQDKYAKYTREQIQKRTDELKKEIIKRGLGSKGKNGKISVTGDGVTSLMKQLEEERANAEARVEQYEDGIKGAITEEQYKKLKASIPGLTEDIGILSEWTWASQIVTRDDYKAVPKDVLFDLDAGEKFASQYAAVWRYRTTRGPSSGKAILPYSSMRSGDIIAGAEPKDSVRGLFSDVKTNKSNMRGELTADQDKIYQKALLRTAAQNLIGGQRYQSTSDFRYEYALDYIQSFWELQALGSKLQTYTKVVEYADMIATIGGDVNLSVMPLRSGVENGKLVFSNVTGMNIDAAKEANAKFDNAQLILVGINDAHILAALDDHSGTGGEYIGFVIPYHTSGASIEDFISELVKNLGERFVSDNYRDYSPLQNDKERSDATAEQKMRAAIRKKILTGKTSVKRIGGKYEGRAVRNNLTAEELSLIRGQSVDISGRTFEDLRNVELKALAGDQAALEEYLSWSAGVLQDLYEKMYNGAEANTVLSGAQAEHIMPHEYWNTDTTRSNAYVNGFIFRSYCHSLGLKPRFSWTVGTGKDAHGDLSVSDGYWKTLIDRPMYNNDGTYRAQQRVNVTEFENGMLTPAYAEKTYPNYKIQEPDRSRAARVGKEYGESLSKASMDLDSDGNHLSEAQAEFFRDSKVRDENGNLMVVYHGTDKDFTVFDRTKGRSTMDIQGSFFSPWDIEAAGYGPNVKAYYLNITNPAPESVAYKALNKYKGQNNAGVKAREYLEQMGYDGVQNYDEYIAFYPEQIKAVDNQTPTDNPDIRYSRDLDNAADLLEDISDEDYLKERSENPFVRVMDHTPSIVMKYIPSDADHGIIIRTDALYLAIRTSGIQEGHYHGLGKDILKKLPSMLDNPDLIVKTEIKPEDIGTPKERRIQCFANTQTEKGSALISVEFNSQKVVDNKEDYYNIIVTVFDPKKRYFLNNLFRDNHATVLYQKKNLSETNPQLYEWLRIANERFNNNVSPNNDSVKTSLDLGDSALEQENRQLRQDLSELRQTLRTRTEQKEYWKGQTRLSKGPAIELSDAKAYAKELLQGVESKADLDQVAGKIKKLVEYLEMNVDSEGAYWDAKDLAYEIAGDILRESKELTDSADVYNSLRKSLKSMSIYVSPGAKAEIAPDGWNDYRMSMFGTVNLTSDPSKGMSIDKVYQDLRNSFGDWMFPDDITGEADQWNHIQEVLETYKPSYTYEDNYQMAGATEWMADEIMTRAIAHGFRHTDPTRADKMYARLQQQKQRTNERLKAVREQRDRTVQNLKDHYKQAAAEKREKRIDSAARTRLLNIVRRLQNKKLPRVQRDLLDQYIADIDTVAKGITKKTVRDLEALKAWYDEWVERQKAELGESFVPDSAIENKLKRLQKRHISDLTQEEVADLTTTLLYIENEIRTQNQLIDSQVKKDTYGAAMDFIGDYQGSRARKDKGIVNSMMGMLLSPERMAHRIAGYNDADPLYQLMKELSDGQRAMLDYQMRAEDLFREWTSNKAFVKKLAGKDADWITVKGVVNGDLKDVKITRAMRMSLYLHSLNEQNLKHIERGGVSIPNQELYKQGKLEDAYKEGIGTKATFSRYMLKDITDKMEPEEKAFALAASRYFNTMSRDAINEVSEKQRGYAIAGVERYFPIDTNRDFLKSDFGSMLQDGTVNGLGFLNERIEGATNPIMLYDMNDVLMKSIKNHSKYVGLALPVRNINRLLNVNLLDYESSVRSNLLTEHTKYLDNIIRDVQSGMRENDGFIDEMLSKFRSKYAGGVLALNAGVAVKQAASYPTAAAVIGYKPLIKALKDKNRKVDLELIKKYTPLLAYRSKGYSTPELGDIGSRGGVAAKMMEHKTLNWIQGVDIATTTKLWTAAEYYVKDTQPALTRGTDAFYKEVAKIYNRIIEETQPNYTAMQRPGVLRSGSVARTLNMFKTQPFQNANILIDAMGNMNAKKLQYKANPTADNRTALKNAQSAAARAITSQALSAFIFSLMQYLWDRARGKDKKYRDEEGELSFWTVNRAMGLNMLTSVGGMVPFGGTILEFLESGVDKIAKSLGGEAIFDQKFYGLSENSIEAVNDFAEAVQSLTTDVVNAFNGKNAETTARNITDHLSTVVQLSTGIPAPNVVKDLQTVALNVGRATGYIDGGTLMARYNATRVTTDPTKYPGDYYDLLFKAYNGDPDAYGKILANMLEEDAFTEEKIKDAMETRMKKKRAYRLSTIWRIDG